MRDIAFLVFLFLCGGGLFASWGACGTASPPSAGEPGEKSRSFLRMADCNVIGSARSVVRTNIKVLDTITCSTNKVLVIPPGYSIVVRADGALKTLGMHFVVAPGARLTLAADTIISLERDKDSKDMPVVQVGGELIVHAGKWNTARTWTDESLVPWQGRQDDQNVLVKTADGGVYAKQDITFTENSFIVAAANDKSLDDIPHKKANEKDMTTHGLDDREILLDKNAGSAPAASEDEAPNEKERKEIDETDETKTTTDCLKEGEVLRDEVLTSSDNSFELWPSKHGSLQFAEYITQTLAEDGEASRRKEVSTIIPASNRKVKSTLKIRAMLETELANGGHAAVETKSAWTPWGKRYNQRVETARQHAGEVDLSVDDQGCLKVTVDGFCVLSRSGPCAWEWWNRFPRRRPKSPGYELRVVKGGMEVQRQGQTIWGIKVPNRDSEESG